MKNQNNSSRPAAGFTIVEILVVIAIITILMAVLIPNILSAMKNAKIGATKADIAKITGMLEQYKTKWGEYPPTAIAGFTDVGLCIGNKTLVACLADTTKGESILEWEQKRYANYDNASTTRGNLTWIFPDSELRTIVDIWGHPFVYFNARDFDNPGPYSSYTKGDPSVEGNTFTATPQRSHFNTNYKYQVWSLGLDEENQDGGGDDIGNW